MSSSPTGWIESPLPRGARGALLAALAALLLLWPWGATALGGPDEPRDAAIARAWADGQWSVVPRLNGEPYASKPPLWHVSAGLVMRATGSREPWTVKATAALWGAAAAAATVVAGEAILGPGLGFLAALLLLGMQFVIVHWRGHATTDAPFTACVTASLACLLRPAAGRRYHLAGGLLAGAAVWAKALHGLLFPLAVAAVVRGILGPKRAWPRLLIAALAGSAVAGAWIGILGYSAEGSPVLVDEFLATSTSQRFGEEAHHADPWWHYLQVFGRVLPWTAIVVAGAWLALKPGSWRDRLLPPLLWCGVMVVALSLATAKRRNYLLPVLPGAALLAAGAVQAAASGALAGWADRCVRWTVTPLAFPLRWLGPLGGDVRWRACGAALLVAVSVAGWHAAVAGPAAVAASAAPFARRAAEVAGGRPLLSFRIGAGDIGQFQFALGRPLPGGLDARMMRKLAGSRDVVILARDGAPERLAAKGGADAEVFARWRRLDGWEPPGGEESQRFAIYEWLRR